MMKKGLDSVYKKLYARFGAQNWWPADSPFEIMVGAILTQNTNWLNVEKAINNLKKEKLLEARKMLKLSNRRLAALIRPAGYYNIKADRLKEFLRFFVNEFNAKESLMSARHTGALRQGLLSVKGIGPETADSMLLYALSKPVFVVDAYTKRIFSRHKYFQEDVSYDEAQKMFMQNLKNEVKLFNEYHALIVRLGKDFCLKRRPKCEQCPLKDQK
ncbi:MAG: endonuclease III domain-containing protein [Candidatus Omnitrophica bacterium]|nr:endonuclease III domain-containing protein [Candidatus Omnitrophota bacterium]MBU1869370.1 endonuclease III domain-containing protein [Candidatus Omnitrophota bacterium]